MLTTNSLEDLREYLSTRDFIAYSGRVETFLFDPAKKTLPVSCRVEKYQNRLGRTLVALSRALRWGAGVNVILDDFRAPTPVRGVGGAKLAVYLDPAHPDFEAFRNTVALNSDVLTLLSPERYHNKSIIFPALEVLDSMEPEPSPATTYENTSPITPPPIPLYSPSYSIEQSWEAMITYLELGESPIISLTRLRPSGTQNQNGLLASGPASFLFIYAQIFRYLTTGTLSNLMRAFSSLCEVLRRGGTYKNGIITYSLDYASPYIHEYLDLELATLPGGSKQGVRLDKGVLEDRDLCAKIVHCMNTKSLFTEKKSSDPTLYSQVCREILMKNQGSCLIVNTNAGRLRSIADIVQALSDTTEFACRLHYAWRDYVPVHQRRLYLPVDEDRQVGVGWIGWANFLAAQEMTYQDHVLGLEGDPSASAKSLELAAALREAYRAAAEVAASYSLDRAFTMAPTQRLWTDERNKDLAGHYACRSIDPPFGVRERRRSETQSSGDKIFYHGTVQTMSDVGHDWHQRHWEAWMRMMTSTGMAHTMSFDLWREVDMDWFVDYMTRSPLQTTYYVFRQAAAQNQPSQHFVNKGVVRVAQDLAPNPEVCELGTDDCAACGN